jgi:hypothetical protein
MGSRVSDRRSVPDNVITLTVSVSGVRCLIWACKLESHAAERARLDSGDLGNFYEMTPHIAAALDRSASITSDQIR